MVSLQQLESALDYRLSLMSGLPDVAYANPPDEELYNPVIGTPFIAPTTLNNDGELLTIDGLTDRVGGYYNIVLNYPDGQGNYPINAMADMIKQHFAAERYLSGGLRILNISKSPNIKQGAWNTCAVRVFFEAVA